MPAVTPALFAEALLGRLGLPVSQNNVEALVAFQAWEAGHMHNAALHNPMNTTLRLPGSRSVTPVGVQAYEDWDQGLEATAKTLSQRNMSAITSSLARSAPADDTLRAVASSPWGCTICAKSPARLMQSYANQIFPAGRGGLALPSVLGRPEVRYVAYVAGAVAAAALLVFLLKRHPKRRHAATTEEPAYAD